MDGCKRTFLSLELHFLPCLLSCARVRTLEPSLLTCAPFSGQFRAADRLREQLERDGVRIDDKARKWSTGDGRSGAIAASAVPYTQGIGSLLEEELNGALGIRKPTAASKRDNNNIKNIDRTFSSSSASDNGHHGDDRSMRSNAVSGGRSSADARNKRSFGPSGHDYRQVGEVQNDMRSAPVDQVDTMLAARLNAKLAKDYDAADRIKI